MVFLKIDGSTEKDLSLPVFAQFIVTQTLLLERAIYATELTIPLYLPNEPLPIKISLYQDDLLVTWWRYPLDATNSKTGHAVAHLRFMTPTLLQGKIELRFDGSSISHAMQDSAPRLFTETFDDAYPRGNYRIAENEKKGDIALSVMEQKKNVDIFVSNLKRNFVSRIPLFFIFSAMLLLISCIPALVVECLFSKKGYNPRR